MVAMVVSVPAEAPAPPPAAKETARTLTFITDFDSPPFSYMESGKKKGFEIDLGNAIGRELGAEVTWVKSAFNPGAYASMLTAGKADAAICSISITPDRERLFYFTLPYYCSNLAVAAIWRLDWNHTDFENGLKDLNVGVLRRSTGYDWARKNLSAKRVNFYSPDRMAQALRDEKVFCILLDEDILKYVLHNRSYRFQEVEKDLQREYYGIAVKKGNLMLAKELNATLKALDEKGIYDKLYEKWFTYRADLPRRPER